MIHRLKVIPIFLFFLLWFFSPGVRAQAPDLILHNGNIITLDDKLATASAVAIRGEKISALGASEQVLKLAGPKTKIIDLKKRTVVPGLIDSHIHIISGGLGMKKVQLAEASSIAELLDTIAGHIRDNQVPAGEWIVASSDWYVNQLKENRFPTRWELDRVAPQNPVFLSRGAHQSASNSLALKLGGITRESPSPAGGEIVKDPKTGELNGTLVDTAQEPIKKLLPKESDQASLEALRREQELAHSLGITSLVDGGVNLGEWQTMEQLKTSGRSRSAGLKHWDCW
jgi:hypothetical protein